MPPPPPIGSLEWWCSFLCRRPATIYLRPGSQFTCIACGNAMSTVAMCDGFDFELQRWVPQHWVACLTCGRTKRWHVLPPEELQEPLTPWQKVEIYRAIEAASVSETDTSTSEFSAS